MPDVLSNSAPATTQQGNEGASAAAVDAYKAPHLSAWQRYGGATITGVEHLPQGIGHAIMNDIHHPMQIVETLAMSAGIGAALKTILPEGGPVGKIAAGLIGGYMMYKSFDPLRAAYHDAGLATSVQQVHDAGVKLGDVGGQMIVDTGISIGGYKLGTYAADRILLSESFDGFADAKANFYHQADLKLGGLTSKLGLGDLGTQSGSMRLEDHLQPEDGGERSTLLRSNKKAPDGTFLGDTDETAEHKVTLLVKSKASDVAMDRQLRRISLGRADAVTDDAAFQAKYGVDAESVKSVEIFAKANNLTVDEADLNSGLVNVSGKVGDLNKAFGTKLGDYKMGNEVIRARTGTLSLPTDVANNVEGVFGLDERPQAHTFFVQLPDDQVAPSKTLLPTADQADGLVSDGKGGTHAPVQQTGYLPDQVAKMYNYPNYTGKGQGVGIVELGGDINLPDNAKYYQKYYGGKVPTIQKVLVNGAKAVSSDADGEVLLDSQVIGAIAPDAHQMIAFADNTDAGFMNGIGRLTFTKPGEVPNSAISISWGGPEDSWTQQGLRGMGLAFKKAGLKGISVFAASGDDGAGDRMPTGVHVDYPAADPNVTGTGGTRLVGKDGQITSETTWNNGVKNGSGGGGISRIFKTPLFQKLLDLPLNKDDGTAGRGVPDVAGDADPVTGYRIRVNGKEGIIGGTSAVAPLYAALTMRLNEALGKPVGPLNDWFYGPGLKAGIFNDITKGTNNGYPAGKGWDAVTGLGSVDGQKMLETLQGKAPRGGFKGRVSSFTELLPAIFSGNAGSDAQQKPGS